MQFNSLHQALEYIQSIHPKTIDLGLDRVRAVAKKMDLLQPACPVIIVGGTNGKGSTVAGLEAIYHASGKRVGSFTSPYLFQFNEEIRIAGMEVTDQELIVAFETIEQARGEISLTVFEFNTLAALFIFKQQLLDVIILEVGLGGRLDAVNIIDPDVAIVTSIAIDHADRLGNTRELIAREKAGIFRPGKPAICGDANPPATLINYAKEIKTPLLCQGREFNYQALQTSWTWFGLTADLITTQILPNLPIPKLGLQNMATVLTAIQLLQDKLPVDKLSIDQGLTIVNLAGRIQVVPGDVTLIFDVSHNPAAAGWLEKYLAAHPIQGKTRAAFSMLADKDIRKTVTVIKDQIEKWFIAPLNVDRGSSLQMLQEELLIAGVSNISSSTNIATAFQEAQKVSAVGDRIVVFGSFYTVAGVTQDLAVP